MDLIDIIIDGTARASRLIIWDRKVPFTPETDGERLASIVREELTANLQTILDEAKDLVNSNLIQSEAFVRNWINVQINWVASKAVARFRDEK